MEGFDFKLFDLIRDQTRSPMTILGGAGKARRYKR
jgi:imidazole glycerol phosphate synthase subunit HisF